MAPHVHERYNCKARAKGGAGVTTTYDAWRQEGPRWLNERLRHVPVPEMPALFEMAIDCPHCGALHDVSLEGRDAVALRYGQALPLPCGAWFTVRGVL